jgi:ATP synthase protein I
MLRGALIAALVVGLNAAPLSAVAARHPRQRGAMRGQAQVVVFSGAGLLALHLSRRTSPTTQLAVAMASYTGRIAIFGGLLALALNSDALAEHVNLTVLGVVAVIVVMGWLAGEIWSWSRLRVPVYDLDEEVTA